MDVAVAVAQKRAIRRYADRPLSEDDLTAILDAGRRTGSSKNSQRRDLVVVRERAHLVELAGVGPFASHLATADAAIAIVTPDPRLPGASLSLVFDTGLAAESMMLVAWERGVGTCPITVYEPELVRRVLAYPEDRHCAYLIAAGYPAHPDDLGRDNRPGGRRPLEEVVHLERW